ncbi:MAG TPA: SpoIVB peptidase [Oscillospiraceae bacterium]|nr:SpoIVB peptidase [Oscillospiraceae bacterium]
MYKFIRRVSAAACTAVIALFGTIAYYDNILPESYYVTENQVLTFENQQEIQAKPKLSETRATQASATVQSSEIVSLKLFGVIPIKDVKVMSIDRPLLIPGGTPFGIKMLTKGVVVIGLADIDGKNGAISPSKEAGLKVGDIILSVDGEIVESNQDIARVIEKTDGKTVDIVLQRAEREMELEISPVFSTAGQCYKAGIWVRDSSAGIGTVTYFDPATSAFGSLGHPVCDVDTGEILPLDTGEVVPVAIGDVIKAQSGVPGELSGSFISESPIGMLMKNTQTGLFGTLNFCPSAYDQIPMALRQEVKIGPATIYTTISGTSPCEYDILIEKIDLNDDTITKNIVIKVTDPKLLAATGGIVQGMSGSPIIQNGKLIGAVTHVFVKDPTKGYGIFCENMYKYSKDIEIGAN